MRRPPSRRTGRQLHSRAASAHVHLADGPTTDAARLLRLRGWLVRGGARRRGRSAANRAHAHSGRARPSTEMLLHSRAAFAHVHLAVGPTTDAARLLRLRRRLVSIC